MLWVDPDGADFKNDWSPGTYKQTSSISSISKLNNILFALFMELLLY